MAISIVNGNRGNVNEKTSATSLALTPSAELARGNYALLAVVVDNVDTAEGETAKVSVSDTQNLNWAKLREQTEANTAALTGVTVALFLAPLDKAGLGTGDTITITLSANATAKAAQLSELSAAAGKKIVLSTGGANGSNAAAATSYSVALAGLTNVAGLYVGISAAENEVTTAATKDAGYATLGAALSDGTAGNADTNVWANIATLANTSTGDTFDASSLTSSDRATILVRLEEADIPIPTRPRVAPYRPA